MEEKIIQIQKEFPGKIYNISITIQRMRTCSNKNEG